MLELVPGCKNSKSVRGKLGTVVAADFQWNTVTGKDATEFLNISTTCGAVQLFNFGEVGQGIIHAQVRTPGIPENIDADPVPSIMRVSQIRNGSRCC